MKVRTTLIQRNSGHCRDCAKSIDKGAQCCHTHAGTHGLRRVPEDFYMHTNKLKCWWCCHNFKGLPVGCPMRADSQWQGNFCGWPCAMKWSWELGGAHAGERQMQIRCLMKKLHGIPLSSRINPAPPRECLKCFGGEMYIQQFRQCTSSCVEQTAVRKCAIPFEREILMLGGMVVTEDYKLERQTETPQDTSTCQHAQSNSKTSRRRPRKWAPSKACMEGLV